MGVGVGRRLECANKGQCLGFLNAPQSQCWRPGTVEVLPGKAGMPLNLLGWNGCHLVGSFIQAKPFILFTGSYCSSQGTRLLKVQSESYVFMTWFLPPIHSSEEG